MLWGAFSLSGLSFCASFIWFLANLYSSFKTQVKCHLLSEVRPSLTLSLVFPQPFEHSSIMRLISRPTSLSVDMATSSAGLGASGELGLISTYLSPKA